MTSANPIVTDKLPANATLDPRPNEAAEFAKLVAERSKYWSTEIWNKGEGARLSDDLLEKYKQLMEYLQNADYYTRDHVTRAETVSLNLYRRLRAGLEKARNADRCSKRLRTGKQCGCPKLKKGGYCYAHARMEAARAEKMEFPTLDDPIALQEAISRGLKNFSEGKVDLKSAQVIAYYLQLASTNMPRLDFRGE